MKILRKFKNISLPVTILLLFGFICSDQAISFGQGLDKSDYSPSNTNQPASVNFVTNNNHIVTTDLSDTVAFADPQEVQTPSGEWSRPYLAAADFNGDGKSDLAVVSDHTVSIMLSNGDGTFTNASNVHFSEYPWIPKTCDVNNDGKPDLVITDVFGDTQVEFVHTLINQGNGVFSYEDNYVGPYDVGSYHVGAIEVGDFDRDGHCDMAFFTLSDYQGAGYAISVLLGNGDRTYRNLINYPTNGKWVEDILARDVDHDGDLDLYLTYQDNTIGLLKNNGDGTFAPVVAIASRPLVGDGIADFNYDGTLDQVSYPGPQSSEIDVSLGQADGSFQLSQKIPIGLNWIAGVLGTADFNGDGLPDIAAIGMHGNGALETILNTSPVCVNSFVNKNEDDGSCHTLRGAANYLMLHPDGPKNITITLSPPATISLTGTGLVFPLGTSIKAPCTARGPGITITGNNLVSDGLRFESVVGHAPISTSPTISGLAIKQFTAHQLFFEQPSGTKFSCIKVSRN